MHPHKGKSSPITHTLVPGKSQPESSPMPEFEAICGFLLCTALGKSALEVIRFSCNAWRAQAALHMKLYFILTAHLYVATSGLYVHAYYNAASCLTIYILLASHNRSASYHLLTIQGSWTSEQLIYIINYGNGMLMWPLVSWNVLDMASLGTISSRY